MADQADQTDQSLATSDQLGPIRKILGVATPAAIAGLAVAAPPIGLPLAALWAGHHVGEYQRQRALDLKAQEDELLRQQGMAMMPQVLQQLQGQAASAPVGTNLSARLPGGMGVTAQGMVLTPQMLLNKQQESAAGAYGSQAGQFEFQQQHAPEIQDYEAGLAGKRTLAEESAREQAARAYEVPRRDRAARLEAATTGARLTETEMKAREYEPFVEQRTQGQAAASALGTAQGKTANDLYNDQIARGVLGMMFTDDPNLPGQVTTSGMRPDTAFNLLASQGKYFSPDQKSIVVQSVFDQRVRDNQLYGGMNIADAYREATRYTGFIGLPTQTIDLAYSGKADELPKDLREAMATKDDFFRRADELARNGVDPRLDPNRDLKVISDSYAAQLAKGNKATILTNNGQVVIAEGPAVSTASADIMIRQLQTRRFAEEDANKTITSALDVINQHPDVLGITGKFMRFAKGFEDQAAGITHLLTSNADNSGNTDDNVIVDPDVQKRLNDFAKSNTGAAFRTDAILYNLAYSLARSAESATGSGGRLSDQDVQRWVRALNADGVLVSHEGVSSALGYFAEQTRLAAERDRKREEEVRASVGTPATLFDEWAVARHQNLAPMTSTTPAQPTATSPEAEAPMSLDQANAVLGRKRKKKQ